MSNTENNELIAEFMGLGTQLNTGYGYKFPFPITLGDFDSLFQVDCGGGEDMIYHSSWDWLMTVIDKINSIELLSPAFMKCLVIIRPKRCEIKDGTLHNSIFHFEVYDGNHGDKYTTLSATYEAVIQFINWYNSNNQ